ncbi:MAG: hypothetical protein ACJA1A_000623 [Saprospiraceae bacterium]|jgi:hypothetical protein|tara:strand:+ start:171 stop:590 length:420 start_codon:yes stop_codon:yes gene_type:complete
MRIHLLLIFIALCFVSCSKSDDEGFLGEWKGSTTIIVDGNPAVSETMAIIADIENLTKECNIITGGLSYIFDAEEVAGMLKFSKVPAKNLAGASTQTLITGSAELIADTLLIFNHQVVTMEGSAIISAVDYNLEFKRKE